jgi:hypothetical protein
MPIKFLLQNDSAQHETASMNHRRRTSRSGFESWAALQSWAASSTAERQCISK